MSDFLPRIITPGKKAEMARILVKDVKEELDKLKELVDELRRENITLKEKMAKLEQASERSEAQGPIQVGPMEMVEEVEKAKTMGRNTSYAGKIKENLEVTSGKAIFLKEVAEQQARHYNVVVRGVKQSLQEDGEDRQRDDRDAAAAVFVTVKAGKRNWWTDEMDEDLHCKMMDEIVTVRRLGRPEEGKDYRPLLVTLASADLRQQLLRGGDTFKLVNERRNTRFKIDPDLTKEQVAHIEKMYEEARRRTKEAKNGTRYVVFGKENPVLRRFTIKEVEDHQQYLEFHRNKCKEMRRSEETPHPNQK